MKTLSLLSDTFVIIWMKSRIYADSGSLDFIRSNKLVWNFLNFYYIFFALSFEPCSNNTFMKGFDSGFGAFYNETWMKLSYTWLVGPTITSISPLQGVY